MKAKHIKVGTKIVPKKTYKAKYNKPDVSTIDSISLLGTIHLDNDVFGYTPDYLCLNYKLYKGI